MTSPDAEKDQSCWYCDNVGWSPDHAPVCERKDACKHCGLRLDGSVHAEGFQRGKMRCAADPYGFNAELVGTECSPICNGSRGLVPDRLYPPASGGCANYTAPATCLTAPSSETARCDYCKEVARG